MKKIYFLFFVLIHSGFLFGQSYNSPESVEYDTLNHRWFISSTGNGTIQQRDAAGNISLFVNVSGSPYGLQIVKDTVYVAVSGKIRGYSLNGAVLGTNMAITGSSFLNGLASDTSGNLYATDFSSSPKKIFRINIPGQYFTTFASLGSTPSPNGIIHDPCNNRLVFVNWGTNAPIKSISLSDSSVTTLVTTTHSNIDGIARDKAGNFYVSVWGTNTIYKYNNTFTSAPQTLFTAGITSPADIYYAETLDTLAVPNATTSGANANTVRFFGVNQAAQTITSASVPLTSYCKGDNLNVSFNTTANFTCQNTFYALLSDSLGSFASPDTIGTISGPSAASIPSTIPLTSNSGTLFRIKVQATNPNFFGPDNGVNLSIDTCSIPPPVASVSSITIIPEFCMNIGDNSLSFTVINSFASGNIFYAMLSDSSGNFAIPDTIGTATGTGSGTIQIPHFYDVPDGIHYRVKIIATNPAYTSSDNGFDITLHFCDGITETQQSGFEIIPNPTKGKFRIVQNDDLLNGFQHDNATIQVWNVLGEKVTSPLTSLQGERGIRPELDLTNQPAGIYFLRISTQDRIITRKIVKE